MMDMTDITGTIKAMRKQEQTSYRCLKCVIPRKPENPAHVDVTCRTKMAEWCFQVVDFCEFNRETVVISMSYLDRFLCTSLGEPALRDRKHFQLVSMCCLYIAIKLFEPREMEISLLSELSRGCYSEVEIAKMEEVILKALQWRMHPPTSANFVQQFVLLSTDAMNNDISSAFSKISRLQTVLVIDDYSLVTCDPCSIALASVMNALEMIDNSICSIPTKSTVLAHIEQASGLSVDSWDVHQIRQKLYMNIKDATMLKTIIDQLPLVVQAHTGRDNPQISSRSLSPVCVSRRLQRKYDFSDQKI